MKTLRKRRKDSGTDYKARLAFLKSGKPRLVVRKTNKYLVAQIVESDVARDKVILGVSSRDLLKHGWPEKKKGSLKSLQAGYLTGLLLVKTLKTKIDAVILDIGLSRNVYGSRIYAVLKGALDGGLNVLHDAKSLPPEERMEYNKELAEIVKKVKGELNGK